MDAMTDQSAGSGQREKTSLDELRERIAQAVPNEGMVEPLKGLQLVAPLPRRSRSTASPSLPSA